MTDTLLPADSSQALLQVRHLTLDLEGRTGQPGLVDDVSFDVARGEAVALIGESGCGKTLTALSIMGLLPDGIRVGGGDVVFDGMNLHELPRGQRDRLRGGSIGMIFQDPMSSLDPTMKVGEQIAEPRRVHLGESRRQARARALDLLEQVGIAHPRRRLDAYPFELSGGMQQRVMIAAAIACDPLLLVADEPTTALDVTVQAEILELLGALQRDRGLSILLVTHDLGVVAEFCERVVVMYAGHVVERASVADTFADTRHPYSLALLESVPQAGRARTPLNAIPGRVPPAGSFPTGCRFKPRCAHAIDGPCDEPQVLRVPEPGHEVRCVRAGADTLVAGEAR